MQNTSDTLKMDTKTDAIQCIFFCEFHHVTGRQLTYQVCATSQNKIKTSQIITGPIDRLTNAL